VHDVRHHAVLRQQPEPPYDRPPRGDRHPIIRRPPAGEDWAWCYDDELSLRPLEGGGWQTFDPFLETGAWAAQEHLGGGGSWDLDEDYETDWVRVLQLGAGADRGLQLLPEVDDEVLVGFEHGDSRRPYVLGGLYNGVDAPPKDDAVGSDGAVATRVWRSRSGHELLMSDTAGEETLELRTGDDKASVVLATSDGSIVITAEGDVKVDAKGNAEVTTQGDLKVEAQGSATIKGSSGLTLESSSTVTIKGSTIKLN